MKNIILTLFAVLAAVTLSACESMGNNSEMDAPYAMERTATSMQKPVMVEAPAPTPAPAPTCAPTPVCEQCTDVSPLRARINELESLLARCREGKSRVQESYREELMK